MVVADQIRLQRMATILVLEPAQYLGQAAMAGAEMEQVGAIAQTVTMSTVVGQLVAPLATATAAEPKEAAVAVAPPAQEEGTAEAVERIHPRSPPTMLEPAQEVGMAAAVSEAVATADTGRKMLVKPAALAVVLEAAREAGRVVALAVSKAVATEAA